MLFDTHCHLQFKAYKDDFDQVLKRCLDKEMLLNVVGSQIDTSERAVELAQKYENIYASVGLHPIHLFETRVDEEEVAFKSREENFDYAKYKTLAQNKKVIAIGECGLEFFHLPPGLDKEQALQKQKEVFLAQYKLAQELNLPIIIHVRDPKPDPSDRFGASAHQEMIALLSEIGGPINGVVHCYTSNWEYAEQYLALGLHIGFTGVITYPPKKTDPKAQEDLLEVIKNCPWDRLLIETDAPYLAPQSHRGKRCEPWMVEDVARKIAQIKRTEIEEIFQITTQNAKKLFKIG